jgi:hypothetical protein
MAFKMKMKGFPKVGPVKPKSMMEAEKKKPKDNRLIAADGTTSTAPTFSDHLQEARDRKKDPDYKRARKVNKKLL